MLPTLPLNIWLNNEAVVDQPLAVAESKKPLAIKGSDVILSPKFTVPAFDHGYLSPPEMPAQYP